MNDNPYTSLDDVNSLPETKPGSGSFLFRSLRVIAIALVVVAFLLPFVSRGMGPRNAARRAQCRNNLKQIGLGLQSYTAIYGVLPPAFTTDANGKPLHSWRTLILPYLGQPELALYETIDLSKPWDDPANAEAFKKPPHVYHCPATNQPASATTYLAIVAPNGCFGSNAPRKFAEITDGTSETLMVIEIPVERAVPWMAPLDADEKLVLEFGPKSKLAHTGEQGALFVDGSVQFLPAAMPAAERRALISVSGND